MFLSDETNRRAFPMDLPHSSGPQTGIPENYDAVFQEAYRVGARFALEAEFQQRYEDTLDRVYEKTGERLPNIRKPEHLKQIARALEEGSTLPMLDEVLFETRADELSTNARQYTVDMENIAERLRILNAEDPSIPTLDGIWKQTQQDLEEIERRAADVGERATFLGKVGGFVGGMVGSFSFRDPFNIATLGVGGVGKTLAARLATEAGAQSVIEGINQFTGVAENRELLGLDQSLERSLQAIAFAAVGGAGIRGVAEGVPMGLRALENRFLPNRVAAREILNAVNTRGFEVSGRSVMPDVIRSMDPGNPSTRAAQRALEDDAAIARGNPFGDTPAGRAMHQAIYTRIAAEAEQGIRASLLGTTAVRQNLFEGVEYLGLDPKAKASEIADIDQLLSARSGETMNQIQTLSSRAQEAEAAIADANSQIATLREAPVETFLQDADPDLAAELSRARAVIQQEQARAPKTAAARRDSQNRIQKAEQRIAAAQDTPAGRRAEAARAAAIRQQEAVLRDTGNVARDARNRERSLGKKLERQREAIASRARRNIPTPKTAEVFPFDDRPRLPGVPRIDPPAQRAAVERVYKDVVRSTDSEIGRIKASIDAEAGTIDIGTGQPIPLDTTIVLDEAEGAITIRALLADIDDDEALIQAMKVCAL